MKTTPPIPSITQLVAEAATFVGIDYHKRYSVFHAISGS